MGRKKSSCDGCGHPSVKTGGHGFLVCGACRIIEEPGVDGKGTLIYIKTFGEKEMKFMKLVPKR